MKLFCVAALFAAVLAAQTPAFEVASIKPNRSGSGDSSIRRTAGQITMENVSLRKWILYAYGIPDDRDYAISGPSWLQSESFDMAAKWVGEPSREQTQMMLQNLLAERFKLQLHKETRPAAGYALVVAKGGPKIKAEEPGQSRTNGRPGHLEATKVTLQKLADVLAKLTGQPVANETGLTGSFSFTLEWTPDETQRFGIAPDSPTAPSGATLFSALQEQLGLKLEGRKTAVEVLVVDRIERTPTEN
jgi:uncharacterized protein (TIGR03435 family)